MVPLFIGYLCILPWSVMNLPTFWYPEMVFWQQFPSVQCLESSEAGGVWSWGGQGPPRNGTSPEETISTAEGWELLSQKGSHQCKLQTCEYNWCDNTLYMITHISRWLLSVQVIHMVRNDGCGVIMSAIQSRQLAFEVRLQKPQTPSKEWYT